MTISVRDFLTDIRARVDRAIDLPEFHPSQRALLGATLARFWTHLERDPVSSPLGLVYLIVRACGRAPDEQCGVIGAFCALYLSALDLLDDVQDGDLAQKAHEAVMPAVAINDAVTLLCLGLDELRRGLELEESPKRAIEFFRLFTRVSVLAGAGQYRDLTSNDDLASPDQILQTYICKTSSIVLMVECGALLGRCGNEEILRYRRIGERLAIAVQIVDDLRDIFGKAVSPDLAASKVTYPVACLLRHGERAQIDHFRELVTALPGSLPAIRRLLYDAGAVLRSAQTIETCRQEIHSEIAAFGNKSAAHRLLLTIIDSLAETTYMPVAIPQTATLFAPLGGWHDQVRLAMEEFRDRMKPLGLPAVPTLRPWHQSHYLYQPSQRTIFYPDLDGFPGETLAFQATLLGVSDENAVKDVMLAQLPAVIAHELFHAWRDAVGRLTTDSWHEEYVANRLAVGYLRQFCRSVLEKTLSLADEVVSRFPDAWSQEAEQVLSRCQVHQPGAAPRYKLGPLETALAHLEMVRRLARNASDLFEDMNALLSPFSLEVPAPHRA